MTRPALAASAANTFSGLMIGWLVSPALLASPLRQWIESRMLWHMLVEFPWLMLAGAAAARTLSKRAPLQSARVARIDEHGLLGLVLVSCVSTLWMLPAALDASLIEPRVAAFKLVSWWLAGAVLVSSWARMATAMRIFLLGNLAWMFCTAGLLYIEAEQRLCVSYLADEQLWVGYSLIGLAAGLLLAPVVLWWAKRRRL